MDHDWTPRSSRPSKLYRVYRPYQYTTLTHDGLRSSSGNVFLGLEKQFSLFIQTIREHRDQEARISPYISAFESKTEAESWALAAEDEFEKPAYILEINVKHKSMETAIMWRVSDIQDQTGKDCGLGGKRDSEWLILYLVPREVISRVVRSSLDVRIERGLPFPIGAQNPNRRGSTPQSPRDASLFAGLFNRTDPLDCGCESEDSCGHFEWPTSSPRN